MTPQDIDLLADAIVQKGVVGLLFLIVWITINVLAAFFGSYLSEKGKYIAMMKHIKGLTQSVKEVEHQFDRQLEHLRGTHALRMAALDKRLEAHQQAHFRIGELVMHLHEARLREVFTECQDWWANNSLYLSPAARTAFSVACNAALLHKDFLSGGFTDQQIMDNWNKITGAADVIAQEVELPPLGEKDFLKATNPNVQPKPADLPADAAGN